MDTIQTHHGFARTFKETSLNAWTNISFGII